MFYSGGIVLPMQRPVRPKYLVCPIQEECTWKPNASWPTQPENRGGGPKHPPRRDKTTGWRRIHALYHPRARCPDGPGDDPPPPKKSARTRHATTARPASILHGGDVPMHRPPTRAPRRRRQIYERQPVRVPSGADACPSQLGAGRCGLGPTVMPCRGSIDVCPPILPNMPASRTLPLASALPAKGTRLCVADRRLGGTMIGFQRRHNVGASVAHVPRAAPPHDHHHAGALLCRDRVRRNAGANESLFKGVLRCWCSQTPAHCKSRGAWGGGTDEGVSQTGHRSGAPLDPRSAALRGLRPHLPAPHFVARVGLVPRRRPLEEADRRGEGGLRPR